MIICAIFRIGGQADGKGEDAHMHEWDEDINWRQWTSFRASM